MPRPKIADRTTSLTLKINSELYDLISWVAKVENKSVAALARESLELGWEQSFDAERMKKAQDALAARAQLLSGTFTPNHASTVSAKSDHKRDVRV